MKIKTFKGGYHFKKFENQAHGVLIKADIPERVIIPVQSTLALLVKKGQNVSAGEIIARNDKTVSTPVHSSVYGKVNDIKQATYWDETIQAVTIDVNKGSDGYLKLEGHNEDWTKINKEKLEELVYLSGAAGLGACGIPTRFNSSIIKPKEVEEIIVHDTGSDPYHESLDVVLSGRDLMPLVKGLCILNAIMPSAKIYLTLSSKYKNVLDELATQTTGYDWLELIALKPKYPQDRDEILVNTILNKKFPCGYSSANIGVITMDVQTTLAVFDAVIKGKPVTERIIAICGPALTKGEHLKVKIGTQLKDILEPRLNKNIPSRIVINNALIGRKVEDLSTPICRKISRIIALHENETREFLSFARPGYNRQSYSNTFICKMLPNVATKADTNIHGERRPCISCNYCEEVCPVQIIPHLLSKYVKAGIIEQELVNFQIYNCIECGLCNYVCPSKISLMENIIKGQEKLAEYGFTRSKYIAPNFNLKGIQENK